jgi:WD40 repeat protein
MNHALKLTLVLLLPLFFCFGCGKSVQSPVVNGVNMHVDAEAQNGHFIKGRLVGQESSMYFRTFAPDSSVVANSSYGKLRLMALERRWEQNLDGSGIPAFSPDSKQVVVGSEGGLTFYSVQDGNESRRLKVPFHPIALKYSPDGTKLAVRDKESVRIIDEESGAVQYLFEGYNAWDTMLFSPDQSQFLVCRHVAGIVPAKSLDVYSMSTGRKIYEFSPKVSIRDASYSPDGRFISVATVAPPFQVQGTAYVLDAATGNVVHEWKVTGGVSSTAFSPDGQLVAFGTNEGDLGVGGAAWVYNVSSGMRNYRMDYSSSVNDVQFSPDGSLLAMAVGDGGFWNSGATVFYSLTNDSVVYSNPSNKAVHSIEFSPDGKYLAISSYFERGEILILEQETP